MSIGIYIGRFQPLHIGHEHLINEMVIELGYTNSYILLGSANVINDKNIFSVQQRQQMIHNSFPEFIDSHILKIDDIYDDSLWLNNLLNIVDNIKCNTKKYDDIIIYAGSSADVEFFKLNEYTKKWIIKIIDRSALAVSGTLVRHAINNNDITYIKSVVNKRNYYIISTKLSEDL